MKHSRLLASISLLLTGGFILAGCNNDKPVEPSVNSFDVTFYDGEAVLKTVEVEENAKVERWEPTKEGYTFDDWYATPSFSHKFNFDNPITADTSVFAAFLAEQIPDTRSFYIVGSGVSPILAESDWGKVVNDHHKMSKAEDKNEYTFTVDLYKDDAFQFAINESWHHQRGFGYLETAKDAEGNEVFTTDGGAYQQSTKRKNIICKVPGNYTFTLSTHPADDTVEEGAKENQKDTMNINPFDKITWVRNGDAPELEAVTTYYIKGSGITKWANINSPYHQMVENKETHEHELSIFLREGEQFMFRATSTVAGESTESAKAIKSDAVVDEASKAFVTLPEKAGNMTAKADGTYTFKYKEEPTPTLTIAYDATGALTPTDYYIDGTFGAEAWKGYCFNPDFKLARKGETDTYEIKNVKLKKDSEIIVQAFKEGSTEKGEWGTDSYNGLGSYNYLYLIGGGENFSPVGGTNNNIKVLVEDTYTILFDIYTKTIQIVNGYDIYIKGNVNETAWNHGFKPEYRLEQDAENKNVYTITCDFKLNDEFGLDKYVKGTKTAGEWLGKANLGTTGDANEIFNKGAHNLQCSEAGTYKVSVNIETSLIDIYKVAK